MHKKKYVPALKLCTGFHSRVALASSVVFWERKEIMGDLLNYWCGKRDGLVCCWPALTAGMHRMQKVPPTNTVAHTSSGYLGITWLYKSYCVLFKKWVKEKI